MRACSRLRSAILLGYGGKFIRTGGRVVHHAGKYDGATSGKRTARPIAVKSRRVAMRERCIARRFAVNGIKGNFNLNQFLSVVRCLRFFHVESTGSSKIEQYSQDFPATLDDRKT